MSERWIHTAPNDAAQTMEGMVTNEDLIGFLKAYRQGATADMIQGASNGNWGPIWTFPSCDPAAAERASRQMARSHAEAVRHVRRARLRIADGTSIEVMIVTILPERLQVVLELETGMRIKIAYLEDKAMQSLSSPLCPPSESARV